MTDYQNAITFCDNCGCNWLDDGLNPIGCPYCKLTAQAAEIEKLREEVAAVLKAVHERDMHIHTCDHCECALCPEGTELSYKAYISQWTYSKGCAGA